MIDVSEILNDPDMCESFIILRPSGQFAAGGYQQNTPKQMAAYGAVRNTSGEEMDMVPEGDRNRELISIRTVTQMFLTSEDSSATSDMVIFQGFQYRLVTLKNYSSQGYWFAIAAKMLGA